MARTSDPDCLAAFELWEAAWKARDLPVRSSAHVAGEAFVAGWNAARRGATTGPEINAKVRSSSCLPPVCGACRHCQLGRSWLDAPGDFCRHPHFAEAEACPAVVATLPPPPDCPLRDAPKPPQAPPPDAPPPDCVYRVADGWHYLLRGQWRGIWTRREDAAQCMTSECRAHGWDIPSCASEGVLALPTPPPAPDIPQAAARALLAACEGMLGEWELGGSLGTWERMRAAVGMVRGDQKSSG